MAFALNAEQELKLEDILSRYPNKMAACIPTLHLCQEANENWVSEDVIAFVAKRLELSTAHVQGVVTFYTLFNQKKPGKHQVWVCRTLSCAMRGSVVPITGPPAANKSTPLHRTRPCIPMRSPTLAAARLTPTYSPTLW